MRILRLVSLLLFVCLFAGPLEGQRPSSAPFRQFYAGAVVNHYYDSYPLINLDSKPGGLFLRRIQPGPTLGFGMKGKGKLEWRLQVSAQNQLYSGRFSNPPPQNSIPWRRTMIWAESVWGIALLEKSQFRTVLSGGINFRYGTEARYSSDDTWETVFDHIPLREPGLSFAARQEYKMAKKLFAFGEVSTAVYPWTYYRRPDLSENWARHPNRAFLSIRLGLGWQWEKRKTPAVLDVKTNN